MSYYRNLKNMHKGFLVIGLIIVTIASFIKLIMYLLN